MSRFGEIPISPDSQQDKPRKDRPEEAAVPEEPMPAEAETQAAPPPVEPEPLAPSPRRIPARKKKGRGPWPVWRIAAWLLLVPLSLFLLYTVAGYLLVPYYIKGPLARSVGQRLDRPVSIVQAVFSPFSLRLVIEGITIGPAADKRSSEGLLECEAIEGHLTLDRFFSGLLVWEGIKVRDLTMRINREAALSSDLADTWRLIVPAANRTATSLWPEWLLPGEITLTGGTLLVDDPTAQKQYRIEQIELYLPPLDPGQDAAERLPRLSAVINASPVQVEAVRAESGSGQMETSFDLKIKDVVLTNYVQELPLPDSRLKLAEGRADLDLRLIFPETGEGAKRILLAGSSALRAIKVVDPEDKEVFAVPSGRMEFEIAPLAQRYRFSSITLDKPELSLRAGSGGEKSPGFTPADLGTALLTPVRTPFNLGVERLQLSGGQMRIALAGSGKKELAWNEVEFSVDNFASPGVGLEEKKGGPSRLTFSAVEGAGKQAAKLTGEGEILPDGGVKGKGEMDKFDLSLYQGLLPGTGLDFSQGRGTFRFAYESVPGGGGKDQAPTSMFRLRDGELAVSDYVLNTGGKKAAAGDSLRCTGLELDAADRLLTCSSLELAASEIFRPASLSGILGKPAAKDKDSWRLVARNLALKNGKVHVPLLQTLCAAEGDQVLQDFTLEAKDLTAESAAGNITAQGTVGGKGTVKINGGYSLRKNSGDLQLSLKQIDLALFNPCLSTTVIPTVRKGTISVQGNVTLPAKDFAGQVSVNDMAAGDENGPAVRWQLATAERVSLRLDPLHLDLGEIMVRKPVVQPGLVESDNLLRNFLQPGKPAFQKLAISKISFEDGQLTPCWPVLLPGYQPRLEGLSGSLSALGQKSMPFALSGAVADLGQFTIKGETGMDRVENYSLDMPEVSLAPFADFFLTDMGMAIETAKAKLQQTMSRADSVRNLASAARFQGLQPLAESPLLRASALLLGENGQLLLEYREAVPADAEPPFLLTATHRQLQRQAVRVGVSEEMVLRESFPKLQLPPQISFAPGLTEPLDLEGLAGYKELLAQRPFLRLRLQPAVDNATDREALRRSLQEAADLQREAENSRRALVKLQREEQEKERLAAIKAGKTPVVAEKIEPDELTGDLEPLPYVAVQVAAEMLAELAKKRVQAVQRHLLSKLLLHPAKVQVDEGYQEGPPQVLLRLEPDLDGRSPQ